MKSLIIAGLMLFAAMPAKAQLQGCQYTSGYLPLSKVRATASGTQIFGCINDSFDKLSSSAAVSSTSSVIMSDWLMVHRISGLATGTVGVQISSYTWFTSSAAVVGGGGLAVTYGVTAATVAVSGNITASSGSFIGGNGLLVSYGVTAGSASISGGLTASSVSVIGGGGAGVTYGVTAGSATVTGGLTASSGTFIGAGGLRATYGLIAGTVTVSGNITASSGSFIGADGLLVSYGLTAGSAAVSGGLTASSGTFLATGAAQHSVVTSSGINVGTGQVLIGSGGYVQWPDGTTQKTAPGTGTGDMIKANANAVTGTIDMRAGSTISVGGFSNFYVMVSSGDGAGVFGTTITIPSHVAVSSQACYIDAVSFTTEAVTLETYFNGDSSSLYTAGQSIQYVNGTGVAGSGASRGWFPVLYDGDVVGSMMPTANTSYRFKLDFESALGNASVFFKSMSQGTMAGCPTCLSGANMTVVGQYAAPGPITKINFRTSNTPNGSGYPANTWVMNIHWELWCKGFKHL